MWADFYNKFNLDTSSGITNEGDNTMLKGVFITEEELYRIIAILEAIDTEIGVTITFNNEPDKVLESMRCASKYMYALLKKFKELDKY